MTRAGKAKRKMRKEKVFRALISTGYIRGRGNQGYPDVSISSSSASASMPASATLASSPALNNAASEEVALYSGCCICPWGGSCGGPRSRGDGMVARALGTGVGRILLESIGGRVGPVYPVV